MRAYRAKKRLEAENGGAYTDRTIRAMVFVLDNQIELERMRAGITRVTRGDSINDFISSDVANRRDRQRVQGLEAGIEDIRRQYNLTDEVMSESAVDRRMAELGQIMLDTERDATGYPNKVPGTTADGARRYREAQNEYAGLQDVKARMAELEAVRRENTPKQGAGRTFVNSYGEATTRYVTSQSYENAMRRQEQEIARRMGR